MFEDSLVESVHRIHTRSSRYAAGSFALEAALLAIIVVIPYLYPAALPARYLSVPIVAPPPPPVTPAISQHPVSTSATHPTLFQIDLSATAQVPMVIGRPNEAEPEAPPTPADLSSMAEDGVSAGSKLAAPIPPSLPRVRLARPSGPVRISAGVAAGQLLVPIRPEYPAIAAAARVQGTVVISATISREGHIDNLRVLSGPPMLVHAAVDAIERAHYRPYLLNGEPVEVETTINVVFSLNGP